MILQLNQMNQRLNKSNQELTLNIAQKEEIKKILENLKNDSNKIIKNLQQENEGLSTLNINYSNENDMLKVFLIFNFNYNFI